MRKPFLILWILAAIILVFYLVYLPALTKYRELKMREDEMQREINGLNAKIAVLNEERNRLLHDSEYVERVIRNELGLVKPGEVVYKFVPEEISEGVFPSEGSEYGDISPPVVEN